MAANLVVNSYGRMTPYGDLEGVPVTVTANGAAYATAAGGLPIDLTQALNVGAPNGQPFLNPYDVVGVAPVSGLSTNGYQIGALTFNPANVTYVTGTGNMTVRNDYVAIATAPATIRLHGLGASNANHAGFGEVADGANTDTFSFILLVARGGTNTNA